MNAMVIELGLIFALLIANGIFSMAEIAIPGLAEKLKELYKKIRPGTY